LSCCTALPRSPRTSSAFQSPGAVPGRPRRRGDRPGSTRGRAPGCRRWSRSRRAGSRAR
jgi:hypothetical protein